jgi:hypothetical protein
VAAPANEFNAAGVFELVWSTLVSVLGTGATATMFRRAAKNAAANRPDLPALQGFDIVREGLDYGFVLPRSWSGVSEEACQALRYLVRKELCPLLQELTGPVVLRLLERQPELLRNGIIAKRGTQA